MGKLQARAREPAPQPQRTPRDKPAPRGHYPELAVQTMDDLDRHQSGSPFTKARQSALSQQHHEALTVGLSLEGLLLAEAGLVPDAQGSHAERGDGDVAGICHLNTARANLYR